MSSARRLLLVPAALTALVLPGCSLGDDGPRTTQARDVAAFTRIDNTGSVDVRLRVGEPRRVRVRAGEKVIDDVVTEVRGGTLHLDYDSDGFGGDSVIADVSVPELDGIDASGSGNIDAYGRTRRLGLDLDGSGDIDLGDLRAREARVVKDGSGDLDVRAGHRLDLDIDGSGDVRYHGQPALTKHVDGSGDLSRAD